MSHMVKATKSVKQGETCTEGLLYAVFTVFLFSTFALIFELLLPGNEFTLGDKTFYISREFYQANRYWFNAFAAMIGLVIATLIIRWHKRTVRKRISQARGK